MLVASALSNLDTQQLHDPHLRRTAERRSYFDYCRGEECSRKPIIAQLLRSSWAWPRVDAPTETCMLVPSAGNAGSAL